MENRALGPGRVVSAEGLGPVGTSQVHGERDVAESVVTNREDPDAGVGERHSAASMRDLNASGTTAHRRAGRRPRRTTP